jgi:hypothetical protein
MKKSHLIFIHGVSDSIIDYDYSANLKSLIVKKLENFNLPVAETQKFVSFENINYSEIGHKEEEQALAAYLASASKYYDFLDKTLEFVGFEKVRRLMITSISDAFLYKSDYWRDIIRNRVVEKIAPYIHLDEPVTVIGHSLGSVVGFDVCYKNSTSNPDWIAANFKPTNLVTFGSPIMLFSMDLDKDGTQKPRYQPAVDPKTQKLTSDTIPYTEFLKEDGIWYNFFDAQDLIAYPLEEFFREKFTLKDVLVQTGTVPYKAHMAYWENEVIAKMIAEQIYKNMQGNGNVEEKIVESAANQESPRVL